MTEGKHRFQVDLCSTQMINLDHLMHTCGVSTKKDLFNNALTILEWAVERIHVGDKIVSLNVDKGHYVELQMPVLRHAAKTK